MEFSREDAAAAAMRMFWARGYEATSLRDLLGAMNVSRSSLYQSFGDKEQLFISCLRRYREGLLERLERRLAESDSVLDFLHDMFMETADSAASDQGRLGCLIFNSATELGHLEGEAADEAMSSVRRVTGLFRRAVESAQRAGEIDASEDSEVLAQYLTASMAGMRVLIKNGTDRDHARAVAGRILRGLQ